MTDPPTRPSRPGTGDAPDVTDPAAADAPVVAEPSPVVPLAGPGGGGPTGSGVHRQLTDGEDLHANLVHLDPDGSMPTHVNDELDVLVVVLAGTGTLVLDGTEHDLDPPCAVLVPRGSERTIRAGADGLDHLTVHRRRGPLAIGTRPPRR